MSTAVATQPTKAIDKPVEYTPLGSKVPVQLTTGMVRSFLCAPTRSGHLPSDADIVKFMMLCKARELDPWVGDAYLTGYDTQNGPQFSLITAAQALFKRAEMSEWYDGIESGVIVQRGDDVTHREGDLVLDGEKLVGGWAKCYRKDRSHPSYDALKLSTFTTGKSRWEKDPAGMIVKCAEASALRKAFPTQLGGLYTREEMEQISDRRMDARESGSVMPVKASNLDTLTQQLTQQQVEPPKQLTAGPTNAPSKPRSQRQAEEAADIDPPPQNAPDAPEEGDYGDVPENQSDVDAAMEWNAWIDELSTADDCDRAAAKLKADGRIVEADKLPIMQAIDRKRPGGKKPAKGNLFDTNKQA